MKLEEEAKALEIQYRQLHNHDESRRGTIIENFIIEDY